MKRLVLLILIFALSPALMGLGIGLWPGGGSGVLHPTGATENSVFEMGDNDTNTDGIHVAGFLLPYDRELDRNHYVDVSEAGFGFSQWEYGYIHNETTTGAVREKCTFTSLGGQVGSMCNGSTSFLGDGKFGIPIYTSVTVEAFMVSIVGWNAMDADTQKCTVRLEYNGRFNMDNGGGFALDFSEDTPGVGSDTNTELAAVELGPGGTNANCIYGNQESGTVMVGGASAAEWCVLTPGTTHTTGMLMVTISDRNGGVDVCTTAVDSVWYGVKYRVGMP